MKRSIALASLAAIVLMAGVVFAETCPSPSVEGLRQPETVM